MNQTDNSEEREEREDTEEINGSERGIRMIIVTNLVMQRDQNE